MTMTEQQLIDKLADLRQIKPRKDWVVCVKSQILGEEEKNYSSTPLFQMLFSFKPALAGLTVIFAVIGILGFSQNSLPGDVLYAVKMATEKGQIALAPDGQAPAFELKFANEKLEALSKVQTKDLAFTMNEFQANISAAARKISKMDATTSDPVLTRKMVEETRKLVETKQKAESLGMVIGGAEMENLNKTLVEYLIECMDSGSLTLEQATILSEIKNLSQERRYSEALELYLVSQ